MVSLFLLRCLGGIDLGNRSTTALSEAQDRVPAFSSHEVDSLQLLETPWDNDRDVKGSQRSFRSALSNKAAPLAVYFNSDREGSYWYGVLRNDRYSALLGALNANFDSSECDVYQYDRQ